MARSNYCAKPMDRGPSLTDCCRGRFVPTTDLTLREEGATPEPYRHGRRTGRIPERQRWLVAETAGSAAPSASTGNQTPNWRITRTATRNSILGLRKQPREPLATLKKQGPLQEHADAMNIRLGRRGWTCCARISTLPGLTGRKARAQTRSRTPLRTRPTEHARKTGHGNRRSRRGGGTRPCACATATDTSRELTQNIRWLLAEKRGAG